MVIIYCRQEAVDSNNPRVVLLEWGIFLGSTSSDASFPSDPPDTLPFSEESGPNQVPLAGLQNVPLATLPIDNETMPQTSAVTPSRSPTDAGGR